MLNSYYKQTIELLMGRPQGMRACNIARHIYNSNCSLFDNSLDYSELRLQVSQFLWHQSKSKTSPFCRIEDKRGFYALKPDFALQLEFDFDYN